MVEIYLEVVLHIYDITEEQYAEVEIMNLQSISTGLHVLGKFKWKESGSHMN